MAVLLLGGAVLSAARAEEVLLGPDQMRAAASASLQAGQPKLAATIADALILRDTEDLSAHLIRARALRDLGEDAEAKTAARRAWSLSDTPDERYASAMVMAQSLSSAGQRTRAQLWLRRAVQEAPNEQLANKAIRDFKYVRATNPWSTHLSFAITPESNINNGSSQRTFTLHNDATDLLYGGPVESELGGAALALSGLEYSFGANTRYRFHETETRAHDVTASIDLRTYSLSSEAKRISPTSKGSDFSYVSYQFGYGHRGLNFDRKGEYRVSVDVGQTWYGGEEYTRFVRLTGGQTYRLSDTLQLGTRWSAERQFGVTTSDVDTLRADFSTTRRLESGARLSFVLTGAVAQSPVASQEYDELGLRTQFSLANPLFGADVIFGLGVRTRDYDVSTLSRDGRHDTRTTADVTFIFRDVDYYGFNPTMTVSASRTDSNIGLYNSERFGVNFGIRSAF